VSNARVVVIVLAVLAAGGAAVSAQAVPGPGGPVQRGFSSQILIAQLSLYLPEEATRGMYRGLGGPSAGGAAGGTGGTGGPGGGQGGAPGGRAFPQIQFTRDPALFLTKDQVAKLLPILQALRDSPLPTPSRAKQVQADVDAQLTAGQKAEWAELQKKMQERIAEFRQRMAASGAGSQGMTGGGADGGPGTSAGAQAGGPSAGTLLQRRQRQLDAFIEILRARLKQ
jgi:hypothetical protein